MTPLRDRRVDPRGASLMIEPAGIEKESAFTGYTADDVQRAAELICFRTHGNRCPPWGQATLLWQHGQAAATALSTIGPIIDRYVIPGISGEWRRSA